MKNSICLGCCIVLWSAMPLLAEPLTEAQKETLLQEGLHAFDRGIELHPQNPDAAREYFLESAERFELLVEAGVRNGKLYYNLGNAYLRAGQLGEAILNYKRADQLVPGDARLQANLVYARSLCRDQIPPSGTRTFLSTLFAWHHHWPLRMRYGLGLVVYALFWTFLLLHLYSRQSRWWVGIITTLVLWLALGGSIAYEVLVQSKQPAGVIVADETLVRKGYGEGFEQQFEQPLHEGVEFEVLQQRLGWLEIKLPNEKTGWIRAETAKLL